MQYLMLLSLAPDAWENPEAPKSEDWTTYTLALQEAGIMVSGAGLQGVDVATTVRVRDGERLLSDGPFADTKEHLIGFYVIEVPDLDTALAWAARVPNVRAGSVEVRPVLPTAEAARTDATAAASVG
ncbi:MAG: YciI family protein [Blastococcus sp.]